MHEQVQPSAGTVAAVGHTARLLVGREQQLIQPAICRGADIAYVTGHDYHAAACRKRMLAAREMKLATAGGTEEMQNLLHDNLDF